MKKCVRLIALLFAANSAFAETTPLDASIVKLQRDWVISIANSASHGRMV